MAQTRASLIIALGAIINLCALTLIPISINPTGFLLFTNTSSQLLITLMSVFCISEGFASLKTSSQFGFSAPKWPMNCLPYADGAFLLGLCWLLLITAKQDLNLLSSAAGILIFVGGLILRLKAIRVLGAYFQSHVALLSTHSLITTGLYQRIRHPSELGYFLICIGLPIVMGSGLGFWLSLIFTIPLVTIRIVLEEKLLAAHFGDDFDQFCSQVPAIIPRLIKWKTSNG